MEFLIIISLIVLIIYLIPKINKIDKASNAEREILKDNFKMNIKNNIKTASILIEDKKEDFKSSINKLERKNKIRLSKNNLANCLWKVYENDVFYSFKTNFELLIITKGVVEKYKYEILVDDKIIMEDDKVSLLYSMVLVKEDFLFLKNLSNEEIVVLYNSTKMNEELKKIIAKELKKLDYY